MKGKGKRVRKKKGGGAKCIIQVRFKRIKIERGEECYFFFLICTVITLGIIYSNYKMYVHIWLFNLSELCRYIYRLHCIKEISFTKEFIIYIKIYKRGGRNIKS